jgi:hypothetical protein
LAMLGIVFQQPTLDLELSVTGNLLFHAGLTAFRARPPRRASPRSWPGSGLRKARTPRPRN